MKTVPMRTVVLGLGNEYRRDDGVGHVVAREVAARVTPDVGVYAVDGDPTRMLDAWDGADLAILIDSAVGDSSRPETVPSGTVHRVESVHRVDSVHRFDSGDVTLSPGAATSTHGFGLITALELGRLLDRLPHRWVLYTVDAADVGFGCGLSRATARAADRVVAAVLEEIARG